MPEVRHIDTRERILDAAEHLFMEHGYDGTSMRQITGDAAVNLAAVNYHFGSKESLMQEVFRRRLASNLAHRRSLVAMFHEQLLGGIENALTGINVTDFWHRDHLKQGCDSYVRLNHREDIPRPQVNF